MCAVVEAEPEAIALLRDGVDGVTIEQAALAVHADLVDDLERARIATLNRLRALQQIKGSPERAMMKLELIAEGLADLEHQAVLELQRAMRAHPLGGWVQRTNGVGLKQAARLLAVVGDPGDRRTVAQLWAYCGFDVRDGRAPKRARGVTANWSQRGRMRARLVAEACVRCSGRADGATSPYRGVYDAAREQYESRDTTDLHKHNMALRRVAKAVLRDLWREARRVKGLDPDEGAWS